MTYSGILELTSPASVDEPRGQSLFAGQPSEVERIDGNAVSAESRSRIEGLVTERFGPGGVDDLPSVDVHPVEQASSTR